MSTPAPSLLAITLYERLLQSIPPTDDGRPAWQLADPYLLRHTAQHAAKANRAGELLLDPEFLIHAQPDTVSAILRKATTQSGLLNAAVYRHSYDVHRGLDSLERRQILALDAVRFHAVELAAELARNCDWQPLWATGTQVSSANTAVLSGHTETVNAVATAVVGGRPVAVTACDDHTVRVWDLATGRATVVLRGHTETVNAAATAVVAGRPAGRRHR